MSDQGNKIRHIIIYCNLFWLLFSLVTCIEAFHLNLGLITKPGSGFFPFSIGIIMFILSLAALFQFMRKKDSGERTLEEKTSPDRSFRWWNIVIILAAISVYALTLEKIGFLINTFLFITLLLKVVEPQRWKTSIIGGIITAIAANLIFNVVFRAQIPSGILGF